MKGPWTGLARRPMGLELFPCRQNSTQHHCVYHEALRYSAERRRTANLQIVFQLLRPGGMTQQQASSTRFGEYARVTQIHGQLPRAYGDAVFRPKRREITLRSRSAKPSSVFESCSLQHAEGCRIGRNDCCIVFDEVAQLGIFLFADGVSRNRFLADFLDFTNTLGREAHFLSNFLRGRFAAQRLQQLTLDAEQAFDGFRPYEPECGWCEPGRR